MRRQPTLASSLFHEPSKYMVQIVEPINSTQKLLELETIAIQSLEYTFVQVLKSTIVQLCLGI